MKKKQNLLYPILAVLVLVIVAAIMMVIGRGHTVYFDNKTLELNGQTYSAPYKVEVIVGGESVAKLNARDRGVATCMGQTMHATLIITQEKKGAEQTMDVAIQLPYSIDSFVLNLPGFLAGLPQEDYLTEFASVVEETPEETEETVDEFGLSEF